MRSKVVDEITYLLANLRDIPPFKFANGKANSPNIS